MPPSRTVAPYSPARTPTGVEAGRGSQAASAAFHTGYKRDRGLEPATAQGDQDQGQLPQRGRRPQARLPRDPERRAAMDTDPRLDQSPTRVQDPFRRPTARLTHQPRLHRKSDALRQAPTMPIVNPTAATLVRASMRWAGLL